MSQVREARVEGRGAKHEGRESAPGRLCPLSYRYSPRVFNREAEVRADAVYVVGGLYGNVEALAALEELVAAEAASTAIVFNGDFHWFDIDAADFAEVSARVLAHHALRGNVETEIAGDESGAGCGCAYPLDVADAEVSRSNEILDRLRGTARLDAALRRKLGALPMHLTAQVGSARVGIVHGDAASLAGWGFAQDQLDKLSHARWVESMFREARVDVFASTHTCLPALRRFQWAGGAGLVANNGAAGMPNFSGTRHGVVTRIALRPFEGAARLYGAQLAGVHVEAVALDYDHERWVQRFLAQWPEGSPAHASYFRRIVEGPRFERARAAGA
ncbi:MAG TPA: hypothetical protein VM122_10955 [Usitatibacter sp.]|nr:hypothetical protein [Usitatibacter sp.]